MLPGIELPTIHEKITQMTRPRKIRRSPRERIPVRALPVLSLLFGLGAGPAAALVPESAWGPMPARHDSVSARFEPEPDPLWEKTLDGAWQVATLPLDLLADGIGVAVVRADESRLFGRYLRPLLFPRIGPVYGRFGVSGGGKEGWGASFTGLHPRFLSPRGALQVAIRATEEQNDKATFGLLFPHGRHGLIQIGAGYRRTPNARFFGIGPRSSGRDESYFTLETGWGGMSYERSLRGDWSVGLEGLYSGVGAFTTGEAEEEVPLPVRFAGDRPAGYGSRSDGWTVGLSLAHDDSGERGRPDSGGLRRATASYFRSADGEEVSFRTNRVDLQQFVPLWHTKRVLALRGALAWIEPEGDGPVPFQRLHTNDDPDLMRGFNDYRWFDEGILLLSAEYRWPLWNRTSSTSSGIDAYLLTDVGQVWGEFGEITRENLRGSWGGGLRVIAAAGFVGRIEVARSEEETVFRVRGDQVFQFAKGGLFHGKNPVPTR